MMLFRTSCTLCSWACAATLALALGSASVGAPQIERPESDLLLEGLDELLRPAPTAPAPAESPTGPSPWAPNERMLNDLLQDSLRGKDVAPNLGEDLGQPSGVSLEGIRESMGKATQLIDALDKSGQTVAVQQQIISDLDELIKQAEKQCSNCSQSSKPSPSQQQSRRSQPKPSQGKPSQGKPQQSQASSAAQQSTIRLGQADGQAVEGRLPEELMKEAWGHLPERLREQMLQSSSDEFLPQYREEIERYFRRLAEEEAQRARGG